MLRFDDLVRAHADRRRGTRNLRRRRRRVGTATVTVTSEPGGAVYTARLWDGAREVGHAQASTFQRDDLGEDCAWDINELRRMLGAQGKRAQTWVLWRSAIERAWRGQGWGVAMYEALLRKLHEDAGAPAILVPERCMEDGDTTASAERVWESLHTRWIGMGSAVSSVLRQTAPP